MIQISDIKKTFQSGFTLLVRDLTFLNETSAILGLNGAGKSTFFKILVGQIAPDNGVILIDNEKMSCSQFLLKKKFGYLPQDLILPKWSTPRDLLTYACGLYDLDKPKDRIEESLHYWDCLAYSNRPLGLCSYGMTKRVGLALATIHNPSYLILDEPFSGLDLTHIKNLESLVLQRKEEKLLTLLSTHILSFVTKLCSKVFVIKEGVIRECSALESLDEASLEKVILN